MNLKKWSKNKKGDPASLIVQEMRGGKKESDEEEKDSEPEEKPKKGRKTKKI